MEFSLLGPVAVSTQSGELPLGPAKRRSVLAMLLLRPNTTVSVEQLTGSVWEDEPPEHARTVIQGHVSKLRATLADGGAEAYGIELTTRGSAYLLRLPEELIDTYRFSELVNLARPEEAPDDAVPLLREALALWRGPALSGTVSSPPLAAAAHALEERRLTGVEALAAAHGALGDHSRAAATLHSAAVAHPLREGLIAALMQSLYRAGRQSDAIDWYHRTRRLLSDDLGVDPGEQLRSSYEQILRAGGPPAPAPSSPSPSSKPAPSRPAVGGGRAPAADPRIAAGTGRPGAAARDPRAAPPSGTGYGQSQGQVQGQSQGQGQGQSYAPHQAQGQGQGMRAAAAPRLLPRPPAGFLGREEELAEITRLALPGAATGAPLPPDADSTVVLVTGPAGVGKTACSVRWGHTHEAHFPDGLLFADLRGFGESDEAAPIEVLSEFLLALGTPPDRIPTSPQAAAALYRSLAASRRLLVILDNASGSAQVRPLLPAGPGCTTLVTSRSRLDGLVATDSARPVRLHPLAPADGVALLGALLGQERVAEDPEAAHELAALCDGLPLALRAASAQLTARPRWRLARLATALRDERRRLALLSAEDTGVAAALRTSVARLSADDA
ncbi:BTAD domain-containing putative transcriptional regulator, partial [Streptomyces sp. NPDC057654]|uniref:AfsR/SARP family transcriptional regulator n=1 Tax=Streptomyces sp. NPDC057654 TaxID=3346196 RepID=UPI0036C65625